MKIYRLKDPHFIFSLYRYHQVINPCASSSIYYKTVFVTSCLLSCTPDPCKGVYWEIIWDKLVLASNRSMLLIALPSSNRKYSDIWDSRATEIRVTVIRILVNTSESIKTVVCKGVLSIC